MISGYAAFGVLYLAVGSRRTGYRRSAVVVEIKLGQKLPTRIIGMVLNTA